MRTAKSLMLAGVTAIVVWTVGKLNSALHPTSDATPRFLGPFNTSGSGPNGPFTDFYFICQVNYTRPATDDGARFDAILTSNGQPLPAFKTTTSTELNVTFNAADLAELYGTEVSCAVRSFWTQTPTVKSQFVVSSTSYFVGIKFWTDVSDAAENIMMAETTPLVSIYFQATVPVPCDLTVELLKHKGLYVSDCAINFTAAESPLTVHTLNVRAVPTPGTLARVLNIRFDRVKQTCSQSAWLGYQLPNILATVSDRIFSSSCMSDGDPHIRTFDGRFYSVYFTGDFLLWKSSSTAFVEVHVRHQHCAIQTVSCNCAVAFREGNNILGVYACNPRRPPVAIRYLTDNTQPARDVQISRDGLTFTIIMPSGRTVTIRSACAYCQRLSITVYPISEDISRSTGLCGNYNGIPEDDTVPAGSAMTDLSREPVIFAISFMLKAEESLINAHKFFPTCLPPTNLKPPRICRCSDNSHAECDAPSSDGLQKSAVTFTTQATDLCTPGARRKRRAADGPERNVISPDDLPPEDPVAPPSEPLHPEGDYGNNTGFDTSTARQLCEGPLTKSPIYERCQNYTTETKESIVESCSLDIQLTGDSDTVIKAILARLWEACVRGIQESDTRTLEDAITLYNDTDNADNNETEALLLSAATFLMLHDIRQDMCPGQPACSGNGTCQNSTCICFPGFVGVDCSLDVATPPTIIELRDGATCAIHNLDSCAAISVFVDGVSFSDGFSCRVSEAESGETFYPTYKPASAGEVQCDLPATGSKSTWVVSVSNDNTTFSNDVQLLVYDPKCYDNVTGVYEQKPDTCVIANKCYAAGEVSATDQCQKCVPQLSNATWTEESPDNCSNPSTTTVVATTILPDELSSTRILPNELSASTPSSSSSSLPSQPPPSVPSSSSLSPASRPTTTRAKDGKGGAQTNSMVNGWMIFYLSPLVTYFTAAKLCC